MKIITFWGGLGNQIIEYQYYMFLKDKFPSENVYSFFPKAGLNRHNGLEINKVFDIHLPPTSLFTTIIGYVLFYINKILKRTHLPLLFTSNRQQRNDNAIFHCDFWQDKRFLEKKFNMDFSFFALSDKNKSVLNIIAKHKVISVHVRRGDYLLGDAINIYGGICTQAYYRNAINWVNNHVNNPFFIFFSDDPEYVKKEFIMDNKLVVDWNSGSNSFIDMYLMSKCYGMILANSSFSYCAARLNENCQFVLCPTKWGNKSTSPDLTLESWIEISSKEI